MDNNWPFSAFLRLKEVTFGSDWRMCILTVHLSHQEMSEERSRRNHSPLLLKMSTSAFLLDDPLNLTLNLYVATANTVPTMTSSACHVKAMVGWFVNQRPWTVWKGDSNSAAKGYMTYSPVLMGRYSKNEEPANLPNEIKLNILPNFLLSCPFSFSVLVARGDGQVL